MTFSSFLFRSLLLFHSIQFAIARDLTSSLAVLGSNVNNGEELIYKIDFKIDSNGNLTSNYDGHSPLPILLNITDIGVPLYADLGSFACGPLHCLYYFTSPTQDGVAALISRTPGSQKPQINIIPQTYGRWIARPLYNLQTQSFFGLFSNPKLVVSTYMEFKVDGTIGTITSLPLALHDGDYVTRDLMCYVHYTTSLVWSATVQCTDLKSAVVYPLKTLPITIDTCYRKQNYAIIRHLPVVPGGARAGQFVRNGGCFPTNASHPMNANVFIDVMNMTASFEVSNYDSAYFLGNEGTYQTAVTMLDNNGTAVDAYVVYASDDIYLLDKFQFYVFGSGQNGNQPAPILSNDDCNAALCGFRAMWDMQLRAL